MTEPVAQRISDAVGRVTDPELRRPLSELDMVRGVETTPDEVTVSIVLTIVGCPAANRIEQDVREAAESEAEGRPVRVEVGVMTPAERQALTEKLRGPAKRNPFGEGSLTRVIAVTSGKGGVGKSTLTANLAVALARRGLKVGLIDADVHGFSIPQLIGLVEDGEAPSPTQVGDMILPPIAHDVKTISIGMFLKQSDGSTPGAVMWRGPMLHRTLQQFLTDVFFGDLDVLLLDMPPGTGDIAISAGHLLPGAEVLVVTTPQAAASDVAIRSGLVARQVGQRVLGVVENMSAMQMPDGSTMDLFGSGGGAEVARALGEGAELLGSVPLSPALRADGDAGIPTVIAHPDDPAALAVEAIAERIASTGRGLAGRKLPVSTR
ncbi:MAG: Mrp/NBP35 family ATP-binding protein [Microbacterium gubbeenense]|uniref:Mrp/NBP35 family ATP-binding protein n=1 Tax=Microbacterium gubbeenense TaxID=159896 RepID=UPI0003FD08B1|nr:Mrp/NBP35 family ATP-binding protein [Microbacterium gubbeenense]